MIRVRVVRSFDYAGRRLTRGDVVSIGDALAKALLTDGTVVMAEPPARNRYSHRMMTADDYQTREGRCSR
jgi:hypothetical protein